MRNLLLFLMLAISGSLNTIFGQCAITGLDSVYCENDSPDTLVPSGSGVFSGTGINGNIFDPELAGPGTHQINYDESDPTNYSIDQTGAFAPIAGSGTSVFLGDDQVSGALPIGFTFNFFGNDYTQFYISSNGFIGFSSGMSNGCCTGGVIPTAGNPNNYVAFAWEDINPGSGGTIQYFTAGTAPNQMLVMNFNNVPHFGGSNNITVQVVLYESSNIIEIHTTNMPTDGGSHTMGIENIDGSLGYAVPGRNSQNWSASNDYVAFIPSVCSDSQMVVVNSAPMIAGMVDINPACVGDSVVFTGSGADLYTWDGGVTDGIPFEVNASFQYVLIGTDTVTGCSNMDTVNLTVNLNPTISLSPYDELFGNDGGINLFINSGIAPFTFDWNNDGTGDNDDNNDLGGVTAGTYTVTMMDGTGCSVTDSATVGSQLGIDEISDFDFTIYPNPSTGTFKLTLSKKLTGDNLNVEITNMLGEIVLQKKMTSNSIEVDMSDAVPGTYLVRISSDKNIIVKSIILE